MIIYFVETEPSEEEFFGSALAEHEVHFVGELEDVAEDVEILSTFIQSKVDVAFLAAHPRLRLVATRSTATDHIEFPSCASRHVTVCNVPSYGDTTVAEHTFALILALARRLREVMLNPKNTRFSYEATRGFELAGRTIGIVGMGRIGQRVAALASAFEMRVLASDIDAPPALAKTLHFEFVPIDRLFAEADIISLHATLSPETYHILNAENLAKCRRGVIVVNTARGALVDTVALREALDSGQVGGAGLDVLQDERVLRQRATNIIAADIVKHLRSDASAQDARDADRLRELQELMLGDELLTRSNVVFTPHVAFNSAEAVGRLRRTALENIQAFVKGAPINVVHGGTPAADAR